MSVNKNKKSAAVQQEKELSTEEIRIASRYASPEEIEHVLNEPDMYVGDPMSPSTVERWMLVSDDLATSPLEYRKTTMVHGILKLADEIFVNCRDQVVRMDLAIKDWKEKKKTAAPKEDGSGSSKSMPCPFSPVTRISISLDEETGVLTAENDGSGIEVVMHPVKNKFIPELVFTTLRAGENGDKSKESTTGGKNGHGAKLAFIWSTASSVETVDSVRQLRYVQKFGVNLSEISEPEITKVPKTVKPLTRVCFTPDYVRANMPLGVKTPDYKALIQKRVLDLAAVTGDKVSVSFNGELVPVSNMAQYVARFPLAKPPCVEIKQEEGEGGGGEDDSVKPEEDNVDCDAASILGSVLGSVASSKKSKSAADSALLPPWIQVFKTKDGRWEVYVGYSSSGKREQNSFVNGVCTYQGGTHVNHIIDQITDHAIAKINKTHKMQLKAHAIANQLQVFVRADISRPKFNGQAKEMLKTPPDMFGGLCILPPSWIDRLIVKLGLAEVATTRESAMEDKRLKKEVASAGGSSIGGNSARKYAIAMQNIENFYPAPAAGRFNTSAAAVAKRAKTELMLTEGLSAAAGALSGLSASDKELVAIYPLSGKPANMLKHSIKTLLDKTRIAETTGKGKPDPLVMVIRILGLELGMTFSDMDSVVRQLHYGSISFTSDQDHDGAHITGLLLLFMQTLWPTLLRVPGFVRVFNTPVVVTRKGKLVRSFLSQTAYDRWRMTPEGQQKGWESKYLKGLGSSTKAEWQSYFQHRNEFTFEYTGPASDDSISLAFHPDRANDRKQMLTDMAARECHELDPSAKVITVEEFIAAMIRGFSNYSNLRAIPHVIDGFKPSMRKVWFSARKRNLRTELKVSQLVGYISEHASYHHGEASLENTIIGMAQQIPGQNNIALLSPCGQFGTRLQNGGDSAAARYVFTKMMPIATVLFRPEDDIVIEGISGTDGGADIEPPHYVPTLAMVLINPASGLGTGWSSSMPAYNPAQIADYTRKHFLGAEPTLAHLYPGREVDDLVPWYQGFRGTIERSTATRFLMRGVYLIVATTATTLRVEITEVPLSISYSDYKTFVVKLEQESMQLDELLLEQQKKMPQSMDDHKEKRLKELLKKRKWSVSLPSMPSISDQSCRIVVDISPTPGSGGDVAQLQTTCAGVGVSPLDALLHLTSWIDTTNMTCLESPIDAVTGLYSEHAVVLPRIHTGPVSILERHRDERMALYAKRLVVQLAALRQKQLREENMARFLSSVCSGELDFKHKSHAQMKDMLDVNGYARMCACTGGATADKEGEEEAAQEGAGGTYDYLLSVRMHQISLENVNKQKCLAAATRAQADAYALETPKSLWLSELSDFDEMYQKYLDDLAISLKSSEETPSATAITTKASGTKRKSTSTTIAVKKAKKD